MRAFLLGLAVSAGMGVAPATVMAGADNQVPIAAVSLYGQAGWDATAVKCAVGAGTGTPNLDRGDTRTIGYSGTVWCPVGARGNIVVHITEATLQDVQGNARLATAAWGPYMVENEGGTAKGMYWRQYPTQLQTIKVQAYLEIVTGTTVASNGWHVVPPACTKLSRFKVRCDFASGAFAFVPTNSPGTNFSADVFEEDWDNLGDDAPHAEVPNPEDQACDPEAPSCPTDAVFVTSGVPESLLPQWVLDHDAYRAAKSTGAKTWDTTYFSSGAAVTAAATARDCPRNFVCLFRHSSFRGDPMFKSNRSWCWYNLGDYGFNDMASSWMNRRKYSAWAFEHAERAGYARKLTDRHSTYYVGDRFNDKASSISITASANTRC